jgi:hypothetical protein
LGTHGIVVGDFIEAPDAVEDSRHPSELDTKPATAPSMKAGALACDITCESCRTSGTKSIQRCL